MKFFGCRDASLSGTVTSNRQLGQLVLPLLVFFVRIMPFRQLSQNACPQGRIRGAPCSAEERQEADLAEGLVVDLSCAVITSERVPLLKDLLGQQSNVLRSALRQYILQHVHSQIDQVLPIKIQQLELSTHHRHTLGRQIRHGNPLQHLTSGPEWFMAEVTLQSIPGLPRVAKT